MTSALQKVDKAAKIDAEEENDARNYLDNVKKVGHHTCNIFLFI